MSRSKASVRPFGDYAKYYDLIYRDKDYERECSFLEQIFKKYSLKPVKTILDAGCGTGQHAIRLARKGYLVSGIDASEIAVEVARHKVEEDMPTPTFSVMDIRSLELGKTFDACIAMFAVMNYLTSNGDIQRALASIRQHLVRGSLFVFDCWNGLAVLRILPSVAVKRIEDGRMILHRIARPELDAMQHLCKVNYEMIVTENQKVLDRINETHIMRFLFPQEIAHYLSEAGFEVLKMCPFPDLEGEADENVWNITVVARARSGGQ